MEMTQSGEEDSARGSIIQKKLNISAYCFFVKLFYRIILIVHACTQHHDHQNYNAYLYKEYSYIPGEGGGMNVVV